jgi:hypothetical protein
MGLQTAPIGASLTVPSVQTPLSKLLSGVTAYLALDTPSKKHLR